MIVYEDAALAVVNKPAGLSSETGLPDALRALWGKPDAYVGVVHRLDIGVSGLMVLAKTPKAAAALTRQITESQDESLPEAGTLRDYLFKDSRKGRVFPVSRPRKGVREAVLEYRITATNGALSLADITLHTGRTHQIRVQFASRKHPLWGDGKYGSRFKGNIALQSARLQFLHPETGQQMEFRLEKPNEEPWNIG